MNFNLNSLRKKHRNAIQKAVPRAGERKFLSCYIFFFSFPSLLVKQFRFQEE